jgi:monothiol glutaredoxin
MDSDWPTIPQLYVKGEFVGGCDIVLSSELNHQVSDRCR